MRFKALLVGLLVAGLTVSVAIAAPPPGKGKGSKEQQALGCKPVVSLILKGDYVSGSGDSFAMLVKRSNRHARLLKDTQVTLKTDERTRFRRKGKAALADFVAGDSLVVHARACKVRASESAGAQVAAAPELLARSVVGKPKKAEGGDEGTTTSTSAATSSDS